MHRRPAGLDHRLRHRRVVEDDHERPDVEATESLADGQHGVQRPGVTDVVAVAVENEDGSTRRQPDETEIRDTCRVARTEHQSIPERVLDLRTHLVADLGRIAIRHHDDGDPPARIGPHQLVHHHGEQTRRTEHHDVIGLDDRAPTALHPVDLRLDTACDHADQRAEHQQTEDRDRECDEALTRAGVTGHRAGVESAEQALPEVLEPRRVLAPGRCEPAATEQERRDQQQREEDTAHPGGSRSAELRGAGRPEGDRFLMGGQEVIIEEGVAQLPDRTSFAGSVTPLDTMLRNVVRELGVPLEQAIRLVTLNPARILGIEGWTGSIETGKKADLVLLDENLEVAVTLVEGQVVYRAGSKG